LYPWPLIFVGHPHDVAQLGVVIAATELHDICLARVVNDPLLEAFHREHLHLDDETPSRRGRALDVDDGEFALGRGDTLFEGEVPDAPDAARALELKEVVEEGDEQGLVGFAAEDALEDDVRLGVGEHGEHGQGRILLGASAEATAARRGRRLVHAPDRSAARRRQRRRLTTGSSVRRASCVAVPAANLANPAPSQPATARGETTDGARAAALILIRSVSPRVARTGASTAVRVLRVSFLGAAVVTMVSVRRHKHVAARGVGPDVQASVEGARTIVRIRA
jgi:hypothetical protein